MRLLSAILATLLLANLTPAQGGSMGAGQGNQGGNGGGGAERTRRVEDEDLSLWSVRTAIVTPGDRVEFKFDLQKGETVFAAAESDAFDPALAFVDAKEKELAKNDDRAEGDQSPFLIFRAPEAGTYRLRVLAFRSAAGGRFTLKSRSFVPIDAPRGEATLERTPAPDNGRTVFRLTAKKDELVDFRVTGVSGRGGNPNFVRVVGPTGVARNDLVAVPTPDGSYLFRAQADGDYFVEFDASSTLKSVQTDFRTVLTVAAKSTEDAAFDLAPGEIKLIEFPVVPNQAVHTLVPEGEFVYRIDGPGGTVRESDNGADPAYENTPAWAWFRLNRDSDRDVVRVFHGKGTVRMAFRSNSSKPQRVVLRNSEALPDWKPDGTLTGDLPIGAVRLFRLQTKAVDLMKVSAKGERFQVRLDYYNADGSPSQTMMDRTRHVAEGDLYTPTAQTYLVRLLCDGYGGAGTYALRRDVAVPLAYAVGSTATFDYAKTGFGLFTVDLEAGKRYEMVTEDNGGVDILDAEGDELSVQAVSFDGTTHRYLAPKKSGAYRLWFRSGSGAARFTVRPYVPRGIGG